MRQHNIRTWGLFALALLAAPWVFTSSLGHSLLTQMGIAAIVCLSYNILLGQGGMLSFGHAVYSGLGAFAAIHALNAALLPVSLVPIAGGVAGAGVALLLGGITAQRSATTFAMVTLGLGELVGAMAWLFPGVFGGEGGIAGNRVSGSAPFGISFGPQVQVYYLVAVYTWVCAGLMYAFTRTPLGRMLNAVRNNPERVEFVGYDTRRIRYLAIVVAGFFAGISGGLAALHFESVTADVLGSQRSGAYLLFTFLGGSGYFFGPVIGAVLMVLAFVLLSGITKAWLLYLGLVFVAMVVYVPGGVASLLRGPKPQLRRLPQYAAFALACTGLAAMVEMVYQLQLQASLGSELRFFGTTLDAASWPSWAAAALLVLLGAAGFAWARRK
ncbi:amino acid/amide ABC transporter membrane protein 2, HAAT family [Rhodoferax sp. OV413]|uniref:branched-chain amino acid ABC transporter permease n=1 Tax=Rhodoferax sp. OV413 TaxID=1855285 RepID=UPI00087EA1BA|nr:branched-chain amino acid ABC transporter permease [Rhodoferax sp. OV413]SDN94982.1 amino acid/amide ABC transporter membrane protein 2, HAAT family [Rhodoferax sp. OV413]